MKKINSKKITVVILSICTICFSCSSKSAEKEMLYEAKAIMDEEASDYYGNGYNPSLNESFEMTASEKPNSVSKNNTNKLQNEQIQRKLIKNGYINLEVTSIHSIDAQIQEWIKQFNGYISSSSLNETYSNYTIKVPSELFDDAMNSIGSMGKLKSSSTNTNDITDEYYDLETRINTKKILRDKYESYLSKANNTKELLEVEDKLNQVISDLESMEGKLKRFDSLVNYSTINLSLFLPQGKTERGIIKPDLGNSFTNLVSKILAFLSGLLMFIINIIIFGIPIILLIALLYWLSFGKLGLIKKLFKKISGKTKKEK